MTIQHLANDKCFIHITHDDWVCNWGYEIIRILKEHNAKFIPSNNKSWLTTKECLEAIRKAEQPYFSTRLEISNVKDPDVEFPFSPEDD